MAPSVGFPIAVYSPLFSSMKAVEFNAAAMANFSSASTEQYCTLILFCVKVPVLSVQITVAAPIVSQACILRTSVWSAVILRMLYASESVTLMASPSGTATTISVTAIIKKLNRILRLSSVASKVRIPNERSLTVRAMNVAPAIMKPALPMNLLSLLSCLFRGVSPPVISEAWRAVLPSSVSSPTFSTTNTPSPWVTLVPR